MNIRKTLIIVTSAIIIFLFVLVASISYNAGKSYGVTNAEKIRINNAKEYETPNQVLKSVLAVKVKNTNIQHQITSTGRAVSLNNITISSEVQGRLVGSNTFKKGIEIKKGDPIFSVKDTDLKLLIKAKKSRFMSLISTTLADIQLDFKAQYNKWDNFFNAINLNNNLPDLPEMSSTKEKNYIVSRSIMAEYLSIKSDEARLSKYTVLAPFDGIVTKSYSDIGGNVNPGSPVVDFIRKGDMEIELTVNTTEIKFINIGDEVVLKDHNKIFKGKIIRKGKFVNPKTQNISVFTAITNNISSLYNGMYLTATIMTQPTKNAFKIPKRAIFENNKVFTLDSEERLAIETVNIISYQNDEVIIQGLKDNTLVVSEPLINTREGENIKAIVK